MLRGERGPALRALRTECTNRLEAEGGDPMTAGDLQRILLASEEAGLKRFLFHDALDCMCFPSSTHPSLPTPLSLPQNT